MLHHHRNNNDWCVLHHRVRMRMRARASARARPYTSPRERQRHLKKCMEREEGTGGGTCSTAYACVGTSPTRSASASPISPVATVIRQSPYLVALTYAHGDTSARVGTPSYGVEACEGRAVMCHG